MSHRGPRLSAKDAALARLAGDRSAALQRISPLKDEGCCIVGGSAEDVFSMLQTVPGANEATITKTCKTDIPCHKIRKFAPELLFESNEGGCIYMAYRGSACRSSERLFAGFREPRQRSSFCSITTSLLTIQPLPPHQVQGRCIRTVALGLGILPYVMLQPF